MAVSVDDLKIRILARVPLAELLAEHTQLSPKGSYFMGKCPFPEHQDKSPSFAVYPDHYHCFGCQRHGDAISLVRELQGMGFIEALRYLGGRYGVDCSELDDPARQRRVLPYYKVLQEAQVFFEQQLHSPHGETARAYLAQRGFAPDVVKSLGLGLTPPEPFGLVRYLRGRGFHAQDLVDASLASISTQTGRPRDFFINRIMIPIRDPQGRLIAYGGRTTDQDPAKYKNSKGTEFFDKGRTLYALDRARKAMREKGRALLVEGYLDALQLHRFGFHETVGVLGTAVTKDHLQQLAAHTKLLYLVLDGDRAGLAATLKTVDEALGVAHTGLDVRVVRLPGQKMDPDEFVLAEGAEALEKLLQQAPELLAFTVGERLREAADLAVPELVVREFVPWLSQVQDQLKRELLASRIAALTGGTAQTLLRQAQQHARQATDGGKAAARARPAAAEAVPSQPLALADREIFGLLLHAEPGAIDIAWAAAACERLLSLDPAHHEFLQEIFDLLRDGHSPARKPLAEWLAALDPRIAKLWENLQKEARAYQVKGLATQLQRLFADREKQKQREALSALRGRLNRLVVQGNPDNSNEINDLMTSIQVLSRQLAVRDK